MAALLCLAPGGFLACAGVGKAQPPAAHALDLAIETEHIPWANPLAEGPLRVLLVAPRHTLRDGAELAQRFEVEIEAVALWDRTHLGYDPSLPETHVPGGAAEEVLGRLRSELARDPAVVILANFVLDILPVDLWSDLYRRVAAGMGLVLVNHDPPANDIVYETFIDALSPADDNPVNYGIAAAATPEWAQMQEAAFAAMYAEGRVVTLGFGSDRPETHCLIPALTHPEAALPEYFDNYLALMGRAVLWAAGRDEPLRITHVEQLVREGPDEEEIPPELPEEFVQVMRDSVIQEPIKRFVLSADRPADRDYSVRVQVRDPNRNARTVYTDMPEWKEGQQQYLVEFLSGPGTYLLDVWLETRRGVAAWHTESIDVRGWPTFEDLRLSKEVLLPNDALDLSVEVRAVPGNARSFTLYARGVDNFNRVVAEAWGPAPEGGGRTSVRLPFSDLIGRRVKLEVYAIEGPAHVPGLWELNMAACAVRLLPVRQIRNSTVADAVVCAGAAAEYNVRHFLEQFQSHGAGAVYTTGGEGAHRHILALGMRPIGSIAEIRAEAAAAGLRREPCLSDDDFRQKEHQRIAELAGYYARGGLLDYGLGDPAYLCASDENVCQSPQCLEGFRNLLRTRYGDIEALNAAWDMDYAGFSSLVPFDAAQARQEKKFAPWVAFRCYMAAVFAQHLRLAAAAVATADSHARAGARLLPEVNPAYAYNVPALARVLPLLCVPDEGGMLHLAAAAAPGMHGGVAMARTTGTTRDTSYAQWLPWRAALLGVPETWLVDAFGTATQPNAHALLLADGSASPALQAMGRSLATLNDGYGALFEEAAPVAPELAIVTCQPARYLHAALAGATLDYNANLEAAIDFLEWLGYAPAMVPAEELAGTDLTRYHAVILPMASALSQEACDTLTQFALNGGLLLADLMPGVWDDMGAPFEAPPLQGIFGVDCRQGAFALREATPLVHLPTGEESTTEGRLAALPVDLRITPVNTAANPEEAPVWLVGENSLLLNHPFPPRSDTKNAAALRMLVQHHLSTRGIAPPLTMDGDFDGMRRSFTLDEARIHALLPRWDAEGQAVHLRFDKDRHATNLLHGDGGAARRSLRFTINPGECALLGDLPYEVTGLTITAPRDIRQGERLPVQIDLSSDGQTGTHLVRLTLETGMGLRIDHYTTTITLKQGKGGTFLPLALDERLGTYFLRACDLLTGLETRVLLEIQARGDVESPP